MQILKAYKFRLEPTAQQAQRLRQLGGCARYVWNGANRENGKNRTLRFSGQP
ncbi:helix-turn-helix domain-containing protein [Aeromonas sp. QDB08]|uniref:helix-turn-helix domain-containing protein n=1 Tax=Aeromonas sp. QDB08 TaxID=2990480 RepID=UPI002FDA94CA